MTNLQYFLLMLIAAIVGTILTFVLEKIVQLYEFIFDMIDKYEEKRDQIHHEKFMREVLYGKNK